MNDPPSQAAWQRVLESLPSQSPLVLLVLGVVFLFLVGRCLQIACNLLGEDHPGMVRCTVLSLVIAGVSYLLWDGLSFWLMMNTRDLTGIQLTPDYGYRQWLTEPPYLKWQVLGLVPVLRYLPVLFAFCLATALYVLTLKVTFRFSLAIFAVQWVLTLMGTGLAAFILTHALGFLQGPTPAGPAPLGPGQNPRAQLPQRITPEVRGKTRPGRPRNGPAPTPQAPPAGTQPPDTLRTTLQDHSEPTSPTLKWLRDKVEPARDWLDSHFVDWKPDENSKSFREMVRPYVAYLPPVVQEFLDDGGWGLVLVVLSVVAAIWGWRLIRRVRRALFRSKRRRGKKLQPIHALREELRFIDDAATDPGEMQAVVRNRPVRLRLVVMAPAVSYVGELLPEMAENLLDFVRPGLGDVVLADVPRVKVWPRPPGEGTFVNLFFRMVQPPEARTRRSHWVLLAGTIRLGRQKVHLGLAVYADIASHLREIRVEKENWESVLELRKSEEFV